MLKRLLYRSTYRVARGMRKRLNWNVPKISTAASNFADAKSFRGTKTRITNQAIIYRWWFRNEAVPRLLKKLKGEVHMDKIEHKDGYALLYIGRAKKGHDRLVNYHILDSSNFHKTGVENGRLSSLRQTICGLLGYRMSSAGAKVNTFMDRNCRVEWHIVEDTASLLADEAAQIKSHYLPLNWQHTKGILTPKHRRTLSELKTRAKRSARQATPHSRPDRSSSRG